MRKTSISSLSLCVPTPYSHNLSDLVSYQALLYSIIAAALAICARLDDLAATLPARPEIAEFITPVYSGSTLSLLAAVFALFAKERLNGFLLCDGGPLINRSGPGCRQEVYTFKTW